MIRYTALKETDFRVSIDVNHEQIYRVLTSGKETKVFNDRITMFSFMATIGFLNREKKDFNRKSDALIRCQPISDYNLANLYVIMFKSLITENDFSEISNDDFFSKGLKVCELYANAGIEIVINVFLHKYINQGAISESNDSYKLEFIKYISSQLFEKQIFEGESMTIKKVLPIITIPRKITNSIFILLLKQDYFVDLGHIGAEYEFFIENDKKMIISNTIVKKLNATNIEKNKFDLNFQLKMEQYSNDNKHYLVIKDNETSLIYKREYLNMNILITNILDFD